MVKREDYTAEAANAARGVIVELIHLLSEYKDDIVLIGGWVPDMLCPDPEELHCGSLDVDIALDHRKFRETGYKTIRELLLSRGYLQGKEPFQFLRVFREKPPRIIVRVDLLAGEYEGSPKDERYQEVQDVHPIKARGCDLAFDNYIEVAVKGEIPGGGLDEVIVKVAAIVPFLVMKGMALDGRYKEKDAYDIYYCLKNYPGGLEAIVGEFKPYMENHLVREGLEKIAGKFASPDHIGPSHVAQFYHITDVEEQERIERDAFESVDYMIQALLE